MPVNPYLLNQAAQGTESPLKAFLPAFQQSQDRILKRDILAEERQQRHVDNMMRWNEYVQKERGRRQESENLSAFREEFDALDPNSPDYGMNAHRIATKYGQPLEGTGLIPKGSETQDPEEVRLAAIANDPNRPKHERDAAAAALRKSTDMGGDKPAPTELAKLLAERGAAKDEATRALYDKKIQEYVSSDPVLGPPPKGYKYVIDGDEVSLAAIEGGPATQVGIGDAAKIQLVRSGREALENVVTSLFEGGDIYNGGVNRGVLWSSQKYGPLEGIPLTEGRTARAQLLDSMEGKIRIESGAAVPDSEIARLAVRFFPSPLDSEELVRDKILRLEKFLLGTIEIIEDGRGEYSVKDEEGNSISFSVADEVTLENGKSYKWSDLKETAQKHKMSITGVVKLLEQSGG